MYSANDWRYYLAHGWGSSPEQKEKERAYNTEYYQTNKYKWYGGPTADGGVEGYFDVNPGGEYEYDEDYKPVTTTKKKKKNSTPVSTYTKYVSKSNKSYSRAKSKKTNTATAPVESNTDNVHVYERLDDGSQWGRNSDGSLWGVIATIPERYKNRG